MRLYSFFPFEFLGVLALQIFKNNPVNELLTKTFGAEIPSMSWDVARHQKEVQEYWSITKKWVYESTLIYVLLPEIMYLDHKVGRR